MKLLHTPITYNERWPKKGVMYAPEFNLNKGDVLHFDWQPNDETQTLKIDVEKEIIVKTLILPSNDKFIIQEGGRYKLSIENLPEYKLYGYLTINLISETNINPIPTD